MNNITVLKLNPEKQITWQYPGKVLERSPHTVVLEARFNLPDTVFEGMTIMQGDRFIETFYDDRWYNIFEIHSHVDNHLRGWYCNVGYPAAIGAQAVSYIDLALDLLVFPDGKQIILDEDEFAALKLNDTDSAQAQLALEQLQQRFREMISP